MSKTKEENVINLNIYEALETFAYCRKNYNHMLRINMSLKQKKFNIEFLRFFIV